MRTRVVVLALGLWLVGAQGFAAQACCATMASAKSTCGGCGEKSNSPAPRHDCCTSLEAQKDIEVAAPGNAVPEAPVFIDLLPVDPALAFRHPAASPLVADSSVHLADGPPLYLRNETLLI